MALMICSVSAFAADKPPLAPDAAAPFTTPSRISATVEFGLHALASDLEADIPHRLASIDERVSCVHKRVLFVRVNANCNVWGYVERSGPVSLHGSGDRLFGSVPIHGELEGQGANRFTARIHGETEASATVEAEARPELSSDWSLDLHFSDGFRWSEPPVLQVMGREIPLARYAEPRIRAQLAHVRARAREAARKLDLHDKAEAAWRHAYEPIALASDPPVWLQLKPDSAAFAGVRADRTMLRGALELSGTAETMVGQRPQPVAAPPLPALGREVDAPGTFDVVLPVRIGYDVMKDRISRALSALPPIAGFAVRDVDVYPSSGRLVIGLRIAKPSDTDASAGRWVYLTGALQVDNDGHAVRLSDLAVVVADEDLAPLLDPVMAQLRDRTSADYGVAWQNLLNAANEKLTRPLQDGLRMEGHLDQAALDKVALPADGIIIALRASGTLKLIYGM